MAAGAFEYLLMIQFGLMRLQLAYCTEHFVAHAALDHFL